MEPCQCFNPRYHTTYYISGCQIYMLDAPSQNILHSVFLRAIFSNTHTSPVTIVSYNEKCLTKAEYFSSVYSSSRKCYTAPLDGIILFLQRFMPIVYMYYRNVTAYEQTQIIYACLYCIGISNSTMFPNRQLRTTVKLTQDVRMVAFSYELQLEEIITSSLEITLLLCMSNLALLNCGWLQR